MRRDYTVEEIGYGQFNSYCRASGIREVQSEFTGTGRNVTPRRFLRILNTVRYEKLDDLLSSLEDDFQTPKVAWYPESIKISDAVERMECGRGSYYSYLVKQELGQKKLVVQLVQPRYIRQDNSHTDVYEFYKERVWVLRHFVIRSPNFRFYNMAGLKDKLSAARTREAFGIYAGR